MTSKLPVRRNIAPLFKIAENIERTLNLKNDKIYRNFSATFDGKKQNVRRAKDPPSPPRKLEIQQKNKIVPNLQQASREDSPACSSEIRSEEEYDERTTKNNWKSTLKEKDDQIDTLIAHMDELHAHNIRFAAENERLLNTKCESCAELQMSLDQCRSETEHQIQMNQQTSEDIRMMKTLVYRLNVQLERHQDELRKHNSDVLCNKDIIGGFRQQDWGAVNAHTLAPLLQAYSEMCDDKDDLVRQYEQELTLFTGRLKEVLSENERIHDEMGELEKNTEMWTNHRTRLQAQLDIFRTKAEVQSKRADLAKEKLVEVLRCYEQKVQSQHVDLERLQEAYARSKGELTALRGMHQNPEVLVNSLKECQKLFEELKSQHDHEKTKLIAECESLRTRINELETKMLQDREELLQSKAVVRRKSELNENLSKKNDALRQSLGRVRLSRESFRNRLKSTTSWARKMESGQQTVQNNWQDVNNVEQLLRQKESQVHVLHARYLAEVEKLSRKLQQRDDTLRRVLHAKTNPRNSKPAALVKSTSAVNS